MFKKSLMRLVFGVALFSTACSHSGGANNQNNTTKASDIQQISPLIKTASDLGPEDQKKIISVRMWLKPHQPDKLAKFAEDVVNPSSPNFRKWLSHDAFVAKFAPTDAEVEKVRVSLAAAGLNVVTEPSHFYVTAEGSVATIQKIFKTTLHKFNFAGHMMRASTGNPSLDPSIQDLVMKVGGLTTRPLKSHILRQSDPFTGEARQPVALVDTVNNGTFESQCFHQTLALKFSSTTSTGPASNFSGTLYGPLDPTTGVRSCGYTPDEIQTAYGMKDLYNRKYDGRGQTVVIVDAYGSPTAQSDLEVFSKTFSLPAPQLKIYQPSGNPVTGAWNADAQDWSTETSLDIEYVHSMAPGAKIALVEALSESDDDLAAALAFSVENGLGKVVSNSWSGLESQDDQATRALYDVILQSATAQGVSMDFSSGDSGDNLASLGYADISSPSSPFMTSVGGTSLALNTDNTPRFQTGWGTNLDQISNADQSGQSTPLATLGKAQFKFGAGGGTSRFYAKPSYQSKLAGANRMLPDISYLADPFTGVQVIQSSYDAQGNPQPGNPMVTIYGGTSLACPMFSAMWAIANQRAGKSLGLASAALYRLPSEAIADVTPMTSSANVTGDMSAGGTNMEISDLQLAGPETAAPFVTALFNNYKTPGQWNVVSFGTDSTLFTSTGWDNVTGLGTPNGLAFVEALAR